MLWTNAYFTSGNKAQVHANNLLATPLSWQCGERRLFRVQTQGKPPFTPAIKSTVKEIVFHIFKMKNKRKKSNTCETGFKILCVQQLVIRLRNSLELVTVTINPVKLDQIHLCQQHFMALCTPAAFSSFIVVVCKRPIYSISVG